MTVTIDVAAEAGAMTGVAVVALVVIIVVEEVVVAQEMVAEVGAMMIGVHRVGRLSLPKVLS